MVNENDQQPEESQHSEQEDREVSMVVEDEAELDDNEAEMN